MRLLRAIVVLGFVLPCLSAAGSEILWVLPDPVAPPVASEVRLHLMRGEQFAAHEVTVSPRSVSRFQRLWRGGRHHLRADEDGNTTFVAKEAGLQLVSFRGSSRPDGPVDRFGKAFVVVGEARADDPIRWSELGHRLEIVPQSDPVPLLGTTGSFEIQVLFDREPLQGALVRATPRSAPHSPRTTTTDEIGLANLPLDRRDIWLFEVGHRAEDGTVLVATMTLALRR